MSGTKTLLALALSVASTMPAVAAHRKTFSPSAGVLCDEYMCADANGVSKDLTAKFLGMARATKLFSQGASDTTEFTFANGVFCDTKERICHKDRYFDGVTGKRSATDVRATAILFGK
jgi:Fels-1 Prophage Protein-like